MSYSPRSTCHVSYILLPYNFPVCRSLRRKKKRDPLSLSPSLLRLSVRGSTRHRQSRPLAKSHSREKGRAEIEIFIERKEKLFFLNYSFCLISTLPETLIPTSNSTNQKITWLESKISARNPSIISAFFGFPSSDPSSFVQAI